MNGTRKARPLSSSESVHSPFSLVGAMYGTEWLYFPKLSGARRLAQPRAWGWGSGRRARGYSRDTITLVGIPVFLMLLAVYLARIYLAKIWVGALLGQLLLKRAGATKSDRLLGLLLGLLILTIVEFIPYLGGLIRLGVVCLGLGTFAWQLYGVSRPAITT